MRWTFRNDANPIGLAHVFIMKFARGNILRKNADGARRIANPIQLVVPKQLGEPLIGHANYIRFAITFYVCVCGFHNFKIFVRFIAPTGLPTDLPGGAELKPERLNARVRHGTAYWRHGMAYWRHGMAYWRYGMAYWRHGMAYWRHGIAY